MEPWRLLVTFHAGSPISQWKSGDIRSEVPGWGEAEFRHPIERLELPFPGGRRLRMSGFEAYNMNIEAVVVLGGSSLVMPSVIHVYGKLPGVAMTSIWSLSRSGLSHCIVLHGREYCGGPIAGWKRGVVTSRMISAVIGGRA